MEVTELQTLPVNTRWRLPAPGIASPDLRCRCKRAACPQSRRRTAAGPCCRRSCSCRSPRLLGVQRDPVKALNLQPVICQQQYSFSLITTQRSQIFTLVQWTGGPRGVTLFSKRRLHREKENSGFFLPICWQEYGFSSRIWLKSRWRDRGTMLFSTSFRIIFIQFCNRLKDLSLVSSIQ